MDLSDIRESARLQNHPHSSNNEHISAVTVSTDTHPGHINIHTLHFSHSSPAHSNSDEVSSTSNSSSHSSSDGPAARANSSEAPAQHIFHLNTDEEEGNASHTQRNTHHVFILFRDRVFGALFLYLTIVYTRVLSARGRLFLEYLTLAMALTSLGVLLTVNRLMAEEFHIENCLQTAGCAHVTTPWTERHGILRVEMLSNLPSDFAFYNYTLQMSYAKELWLRDGIDPLTWLSQHDGDGRGDHSSTTPQCDTSPADSPNDTVRGCEQSYASYAASAHHDAVSEMRQKMSDIIQTSHSTYNSHIMEYALNYGLLRLSLQLRSHFSVPVTFLVINADKPACYLKPHSSHAYWLKRFFMRNVIGYNNIMLAALHTFSDSVLRDNSTDASDTSGIFWYNAKSRGYLRNVITSEYFRLTSTLPVTCLELLFLLALMFTFTLIICVLLRCLHRQIYSCIVDVLRSINRGRQTAATQPRLALLNMCLEWPIGQLFIVILALLGLETFMSEFFSEPTTALHVILIVWLVDQYSAICCRSAVSRRHFPRFFYLYQFVFYYYNYRYHGRFCELSLATFWLFTQHAMIYFFHRYEMPAVAANRDMNQMFSDIWPHT